MSDKIRLHHGDGGKHMDYLIKDLFYSTFNTPISEQGKDGATITLPRDNIVFTTDSFVIKPIFFNGGDIGKLAVCGTLNDLAVSGAKPLYLSLALIIEEGFEMDQLFKIVQSINEICIEQEVRIVTGDTKVVEKGGVDQIFINTSGIGGIINNYYEKEILAGDDIIITGSIGNHGATITAERYKIGTFGDIKSDCEPLTPIIIKVKDYFDDIKIMKDPTRGGLASVLNEIALKYKVGIDLFENQLPISGQVQGISNLLGLDPLYLACEGRAIMIVTEGKSKHIVKSIQELESGREAKIIGKITKDSGFVVMHTPIGGKRIVRMLETPMLPRMC